MFKISLFIFKFNVEDKFAFLINRRQVSQRFKSSFENKAKFINSKFQFKAKILKLKFN